MSTVLLAGTPVGALRQLCSAFGECTSTPPSHFSRPYVASSDSTWNAFALRGVGCAHHFGDVCDLATCIPPLLGAHRRGASHHRCWLRHTGAWALAGPFMRRGLLFLGLGMHQNRTPDMGRRAEYPTARIPRVRDMAVPFRPWGFPGAVARQKRGSGPDVPVVDPPPPWGSRSPPLYNWPLGIEGGAYPLMFGGGAPTADALRPSGHVLWYGWSPSACAPLSARRCGFAGGGGGGGGARPIAQPAASAAASPASEGLVWRKI